MKTTAFKVFASCAAIVCFASSGASRATTENPIVDVKQHKNLVGLEDVVMDLKRYISSLIANKMEQILATGVHEESYLQRKSYDLELDNRLRKEMEGDGSPNIKEAYTKVSPPRAPNKQDLQDSASQSKEDLQDSQQSNDIQDSQQSNDIQDSQQSNDIQEPQESNGSQDTQSNDIQEPQESDEGSYMDSGDLNESGHDDVSVEPGEKSKPLSKN